MKAGMFVTSPLLVAAAAAAAATIAPGLAAGFVVQPFAAADPRRLDGIPPPSTPIFRGGRRSGGVFVTSSGEASRLLRDNNDNGLSCSLLLAGGAFRGVAAVRSPRLLMSRDSGDDGEGPGLAATIGLVLILVVFLISSAAPFLDVFNTDAGVGSVTSELANTAVTRQDPSSERGSGSAAFALSRGRIQEKLSGLPAFYVVDDATGTIAGGEIYTSYADAEGAAKKEAAGAAAAAVVRATTLDQVMYPLVLGRGRTKKPAGPPPAEILKAEEAMNDVAARGGDEGNVAKYKLVPSAAARRDAANMNMYLSDGDLPLFLADRLAFAGSSGPQVPLFLEKADAITSYLRLRASSGGNGNKLPEEPSIRSTTLLEEIDSMERGTRPGVSQLAFYAPEMDLVRADELMGR